MFQSHACKNSKRLLLSKKKLVVFGLKTSFERYAIVRLIVVEGDPLCLKYYPWIVSLFSFSPPSPPLLCPPPL